MKNISTNCKFCKAPITLAIDDRYDEVRDFHKLIPLASCNPCADVRVKRRMLEAMIAKTCRSLQLLPESAEDDRGRIKEALVSLTKHYAKMICRWNRMEGMIWDEAVVDEIMGKPNELGPALGRMWRAFKDWQRQQTMEL